MSLCAITEVGQFRTHNEDAYALSNDGLLWALADGMGGHTLGEMASTLAVSAIMEVLQPARREIPVRDRLTLAFAKAQSAVAIHSLERAGWRGMGSTAVAGVVEGDIVHICHVGDSRAYHWSGGRLRRLTNDHSWAGELIAAGLLTPEQARSHPLRGSLTRAIGAKDCAVPEFTSVKVKDGDRVLLCSDGLWEALGDGELRAELGSRGSMRQVATALVDRANSASGRDNITAILYRHSGNH